jgi:hypothetical protein
VQLKIDLLDAYKQVHMCAEDVDKTAFVTITGTYVSHIMQQGDFNAPATFQQLMTSIFCDVISHSVHVYLDDIFVFSKSPKEYEKHLKEVFDHLQSNSLYLKWAKCNLYSKSIDCLGHIIDNKGIHPDADKLACIVDWRTPQVYNNIQRFIGLVNYVANFLPDVTTYSGPLMSMTQNGAPFHWCPISLVPHPPAVL